jgi:flagellar hook-length control protein FliK
MPANVATVAAPVVAAAQLAAMNSQGTSIASAETPDSNANPFAALYQQLIGKQAAKEQDLSALLKQPADPLLEAPADLNALLPFMEAMGLARSDADTTEEELPATEGMDNSTDILLASALTPQVQALQGPAIIAGTTAGALSSDRTPISFVRESALSTQEAVIQNQSAKETSAGLEFSTQLVSAIETNVETGNTTNAVQQIIEPTSLRNGPASLPVTQSVGASGWSEEVGNKVVWMANRTESRADLVLTPPEMGRVEVSLSVKGEQATANFISGNPAVREALEAALPRLREILADAGIQLNQAQVGAENPRDSARQEKSADNFGSDRSLQDERTGHTADAGAASKGNGLKLGRGLVDVFA